MDVLIGYGSVSHPDPQRRLRYTLGMVPARTNAIGVASHPFPDRRVEWGLSSLRNSPAYPEHDADSLVANMGKNGGSEACLWCSTDLRCVPAPTSPAFGTNEPHHPHRLGRHECP